MRSAALTAAFLTLVTPALAVDLKNCDDINSTRDRTECLQANLVLLNSSYQTVAAELRSAVQALQEENRRQTREIETLREELRQIKPSPPPDLSNYVTYGTTVQLQSQVWGTHCLDHNTHNASHIQGWPCNDVQKWVLHKK